MSRYILKRLLSAIPTLFVLITLAFFLMRLAPGGPFDEEKPVPRVIQERLEAAYGLDQPLHVQYVRYVGNLLKGDFGPSYQYKDRTVTELIGAGFPVSLRLGAIALLLACWIGITAGAIAALRQNSPLDHSVMTVAMVGITIPNFVVAPLLILVFAVYWQILPASGIDPRAGFTLKNTVLPVIALALPQIAYISRLTRGSMIEVMRSNFIRTARAKGLSERLVVMRHAMKPTLLPVVSYLGPAAAALITGSVVVEQIFGIPGIGRYFVQGALNRDYTLVMGVVVFYGTLIIVFNLIVDLLYAVLDPRVKHA